MTTKKNDRTSIFPDRYLGDGVYASFDGFGIALELRAQPARDPTRIYLEPEVMGALRKYERVVLAILEARRASEEASA